MRMIGRPHLFEFDTVDPDVKVAVNLRDIAVIVRVDAHWCCLFVRGARGPSPGWRVRAVYNAVVEAWAAL